MKISAAQLRRVRGHMDLTQAELADHLDVSPRTIVNWESNGVPDSKTDRVLSLIAPVIRELDVMDDMKNGPDNDEERYESLKQEGFFDRVDALVDPASRWGVTTPTPDDRLAKLLEPFSVVDLLSELRRRALQGGITPNLWNADRVERYQRYVAPRWSERSIDPDLSKMSDQDAKDYGLAAYKGEENIGFDDIPHEP